jgi:hypothetical protein
MVMKLMGNLDDDLCCGCLHFMLVARLVMVALKVVVFHNDGWGYFIVVWTGSERTRCCLEGEGVNRHFQKVLQSWLIRMHN